MAFNTLPAFCYPQNITSRKWNWRVIGKWNSIYFSSDIPYKSNGNINNFWQKICTQSYHLQQFYILNHQIKKNQALYLHIVFLTVLINDSWLFTNFKFRLLLLKALLPGLYHTDLQFWEYTISNCVRNGFANKKRICLIFLINIKQFDLMVNNCSRWVYTY